MIAGSHGHDPAWSLCRGTGSSVLSYVKGHWALLIWMSGLLHPSMRTALYWPQARPYSSVVGEYEQCSVTFDLSICVAMKGSS